MKKILLIVAVACVIVGLAFLAKKKEVAAPVSLPVTANQAELCFGLFTPPNERGFSDKYTLHMLINNDKGTVTGELKFLPGEKDSKTGSFTGTVSAVDKTMMARTADIWWDTFGEGIRTTEQLRIIFGEGTASIGTGELVDRGDGTYVYKDPEHLEYGLKPSDVACSDLVLRDNIEAYIRANISALSPVKPVLGGTWYVIGVSADLLKHSGTVVYEDGHIQEKKNFTFTADKKNAITNVTIR